MIPTRRIEKRKKKEWKQRSELREAASAFKYYSTPYSLRTLQYVFAGALGTSRHAKLGQPFCSNMGAKTLEPGEKGTADFSIHPPTSSTRPNDNCRIKVLA